MPIHWDAPNKRWRYQFKRVIAGQRHRISKLLPAGWSQAEADAFDRLESARLYAVASGVRRLDPLIDEAVMLYLSDKTALKSYRATVEHLAAIAWAYTGKPVSALPSVTAEVTRAENERGMAPATIKNRLACLKAACRWAWKRHGLTEHDPTARMQMPTVQNERHVYLTRKQMLTLAWATHSHAVRILVRVAFYSGMRLGELERVVVEDGVLHLADSKNGERRSVPAHPRIRTCLDYLPLSMPRATLHKYLRLARETTGLDGSTFHTLRHSAASEMANAGIDLFTVGQVLGHKDPRSTQRYSHLTAKTLSGAVNKIGARQMESHNRPLTGRKKATKKAA